MRFKCTTYIVPTSPSPTPPSHYSLPSPSFIIQAPSRGLQCDFVLLHDFCKLCCYSMSSDSGEHGQSRTLTFSLNKPLVRLPSIKKQPAKVASAVQAGTTVQNKQTIYSVAHFVLPFQTLSQKVFHEGKTEATHTPPPHNSSPRVKSDRSEFTPERRLPETYSPFRGVNHTHRTF